MRYLLLTFICLSSTPLFSQGFIAANAQYAHPLGELGTVLQTGPLGLGFSLGSRPNEGHFQFTGGFEYSGYQTYTQNIPWGGHHYQHSDADKTWTYDVRGLFTSVQVFAFRNSPLTPFAEFRAGINNFRTHWSVTDPYQTDNCRSPQVLDKDKVSSHLATSIGGGFGFQYENEKGWFISASAQFTAGGKAIYQTRNPEFEHPSPTTSQAGSQTRIGGNGGHSHLETQPWLNHYTRTGLLYFKGSYGFYF